MIDPRPSFDSYFLGIAEAVSRRATCPRASVGAVLVSPGGFIIATGYNGAPRGEPHCIDQNVGCQMVEGHCVRTIHAELNAVLQAAMRGASVAGATLYTTHTPCFRCTQLLKQAGIERWVAAASYGKGDPQL